ncbi:hypothetical protein GLOTRDRAFT_21349, partial [Gloeophyllum trabeum ATCC 11539]
SFDISSPLGAFHYATFCCLVATTFADALKNEFEAARDSFLEMRKKQGKALQWSMEHQ